ncbi:MAG: hypothetical protein LBS30_01710, partial [Planctomycetota bacterium]|nr:hypothetical protein [Planctomycetota bacterium]
MRSIAACVVFLVLAVAAVPAADSPEVIFQGPPSGWATRFASPVRLEVRGGGGELTVVTGRGNYEVRSRAALSGAPTEFVEAILFGLNPSRVEWTLPGADGYGYAGA